MEFSLEGEVDVQNLIPEGIEIQREMDMETKELGVEEILEKGTIRLQG